ncbi:hydrophobic surface binding protein A-domain-containing protein [Xylariales sp. PMI_506]|nr:hydrophobic surface binding protein A-domain-containing protein [Xylariales sp. PMI_506]
MRLSFALALAASFVGTSLGTGADIVSALDTLLTESTTFQSALSSWTGNILGAIPLAEQTTEVYKSIVNATSVATASANLTAIEALTVTAATTKLVLSTNATLTALINAKSQFDSVKMSTLLYLTLDIEKAASDKLSAAISSKLPTLYQAAALVLTDTLNTNFETALTAFK